MVTIASTPPRSRLLHYWEVGTWLGCWGLLCLILLPHNRDPTVVQWSRFSFFDYRDTVWMPIRDFWAGGLPWDTPTYLSRHPGIQPFLLYVPSYWWVLAPLTLLPYSVSIAAWLGVTSASYVYLIRKGLGVSAPESCATQHRWLLPLMSLAFLAARPVKSALFQGQFAMPCAAAAIFVLGGVRAPRSSTFATMVALVKPPVGLPLIAVMLLTDVRRSVWRALGASLVLCFPIAIITVIRVGGLRSSVKLARNSLAQGSGQVDGGPVTYVDVRGLVHGLWPSCPVWIQLLAILAAVVCTLPMVRRAHALANIRPDLYLAATGLAMVLIAPTILYATVVLIPGWLLLVRRFSTQVRQRKLARLWLVGSVVLLLLIPMFASEGLFRLLHFGTQGSNALNATCLLAAAGVLNALVWRAPLGKRAMDPSTV